jgi:uncharacterized protein
MKYTTARLGRIFVLKFDDGDNMQEEIRSFCGKERVSTATLVFIGALRKGKVVAGPKKPVVPPQPNVVSYRDAWEVMGIGTIFPDERKRPQVHLHASLGKGKKTLTGCIRQDSNVFLVIEAFVFEMKNARAAKLRDPRTGLNLLRVLAG